MKNGIVRVSLFATTAFAIARGAGAHHAMEYAAPATALEGVLSGFAHPIIGLDHFLFIVGLGAACYYFAQPLSTVLAFLVAALVGTMLHLAYPTLPYAEAGVAASLLALGWVFLRGQRAPAPGLGMAAGFFALAGLLHGYAYGEAVLGAEATPIVAYLAGFTLVQLLVVGFGYAIARHLDRLHRRASAIRVASLLLLIPGAGFLLMALAA